MDKIDRAVEVFVDPRWEIYSYVSDWNGDTYWEKRRDLCGHPYTQAIVEFTRSRDALKAIRPEGWYITTSYTIRGAECSMIDSSGRGMVYCHLPTKTEELAELHAIIQAIEYEKKEI